MTRQSANIAPSPTISAMISRRRITCPPCITAPQISCSLRKLHMPKQLFQATCRLSFIGAKVTRHCDSTRRTISATAGGGLLMRLCMIDAHCTERPDRLHERTVPENGLFACKLNESDTGDVAHVRLHNARARSRLPQGKARESKEGKGVTMTRD